MVNQIRPLARLFRGMAELIDQDQTSRSRYEAIAKAAGVVAARATAQELVAGRLWQVDGADLLASAYAFHAGLPRQAATAATNFRGAVVVASGTQRGGNVTRATCPRVTSAVIFCTDPSRRISSS